MDLMSIIGEYQTKESPDRIIWEYYKTIIPEKRDSSGQEGLGSLPEVEWAVADTQRGMTQDEVEIVCQGATPWKTGIFLRGRIELFTGGWVTCCWVPKRDDAGWNEISLPMCNTLKNGHLPERKGWVLYRRVSELLLSPKEGWHRWSEITLPMCNTEKNGHLPEKKGRALYRKRKGGGGGWGETGGGGGWGGMGVVSDLVLSPKEGWRRQWEEWLQNWQRK